MDLEIKVSSCKNCPFSNIDQDRGYLDQCNAPNSSLGLDEFEELPKVGVHELCPLKDNVIIKISYYPLSTFP